ncbi:protein kinase [Anaeramoeba flamelloides]|uniref:Protein kinase n=1 Tax=Anaeramoeba flamelloides TaxID=1746091 RepID=A0AAV7ZAT1_9EUKA|nr:protein kinase [Anaeramoeba flamelloides]
MSLQTIGPYQIWDTIGVGSFSKVKYATHTETNKPYAIKIISKQKILNQKNSRDRVKKEIAVQKILKHPNILRLFEVYESENNLFLVLEYISGGELFDYIVDQNKIEPEEALKFFQQIIYGVEYIHSVSITHRDLKPENLLLDQNKNIKIADFGMARVIESQNLLKTPCGSPHYVSPELLKGQGYDGKKSDIWACGVILYVLLTSELPFNESNYPDLLKSICSGSYRVPSTLTKIQKDLLRRMLTVDPKKRITIEEIKKHPWFNLNLSKKYTHPKPTINYETICKKEIKTEEIDKNLIDSLKQFGWTDLNEIYTSLLSTEVNTIKVFYYFLKKKNFQKLNSTKTKKSKVRSNNTVKQENKKSLLPIKKRKKFLQENKKNIIRSRQNTSNGKNSNGGKDHKSKFVDTKRISELENLIELTDLTNSLKIEEYKNIIRQALQERKTKRKKDKKKRSTDQKKKKNKRKTSPLRKKSENIIMNTNQSKSKNKSKSQLECYNTENNSKTDLEPTINDLSLDHEKDLINENDLVLNNNSKVEEDKKKTKKKKKIAKKKNKPNHKKKHRKSISLESGIQLNRKESKKMVNLNNSKSEKSELKKGYGQVRSKSQIQIKNQIKNQTPNQIPNNSNEKFPNLKIQVGEKNNQTTNMKINSLSKRFNSPQQKEAQTLMAGTPRFHRRRKKKTSFVPITPKQSEIGRNKKGWFGHVVSKKKQKKLNSKLKRKLKKVKRDLMKQLNNNQNLPIFICNDRIIAISSASSYGNIMAELQTALNICNYNWVYKHQNALKAFSSNLKIKMKIHEKDSESIIEYVSQNMMDINKQPQNNNTFSEEEKMKKIKSKIKQTLEELSQLQNRSWKLAIEFIWKTGSSKKFIEEAKTLINFLNQ